MGRLFCFKNRIFTSLISSLVIIGIVVPSIPVQATTCAVSGNNVTISSNCIFDAGTYTFTGTLTINAGVTVTAASNVGNGQVVIISDSITVLGTISGNGTGSAAGAGVGAGETSSTSGGGGGYGGNGGSGGAGSSNGGTPHGSVTQPTALGSGGGNDLNNGGSGGAGGGSVKLQLGGAGTGTITISGTVSVNGSGGTINDTGGGSGGSVWIDAPNGTVTGAGTVSANGGAAVAIEGGGGGAGGRVAIYYSGTAPTFAMQAFGNTGSTQTGFEGQAGGAGTIYMKSAAQTNGDLILDNTNRDGANTTQIAPSSQTYDNITVKRLAKYVIPSTFTTTVVNSPVSGLATAGRITTNSGGTFVGPSSLTLNAVNFTNAGDISGVTSFTIGSGSTFQQNTGAGTFSSGPPSFTVASGGTLTTAFASTFTVSALTVQSGGTLTHNDNSTARTNVLDLAATTVTINSGGNVNLDGRGFDTDLGTGKGTTAANSGGGAGYGGFGGNGGNGASSAGGVIYGSLTAPTDIGSGGASDESGAGTSGGGFAKFVVSGTLTNNGTISANGVTVTLATDSGAGSGGGLDITAGTLAGTGTIRANGGSAETNNGGGGGAGGRVAIKYTSGVPTSYALQALGGAGGNQASFSGEDGGAGTIYLKSDAQTNGDLIIKNNNNNNSAFTTQQAPASQTFDNITVADGAEYRVPTGFTLVLAPGGTMTGGGSVQGFIQIDSGATFEPNAATFTLGNNSKIINNGTVPTVTSLTVTTGATFIHNTSTGSFSATLTDLTIGSSGATFSVSQSNIFAVPNITVQSGGTLTHEANGSTTTHVLHVSATNIDVQTGGTISANAKGFSGSNGTGEGVDGSEGGGAGYGGDGGNADSGTAGGVTYGDVKQPNALGSGGGDDTSVTGQQGGAGGGLVRLVVSGTLTIAGTISSNGGNGVANEGGGGSGGSVWLDTNAIAGSGAVTANGGAGSPQAVSTVGGGGGGGGRISINFNTGAAGGARQAFGGNRGGTTSAVGGAGGAGTIFTDDKDDAFANGDLIIDNNSNAGIAASSETTQVATASQTYDNLTVRGGAKYVIPSAMTLTVSPGGTLTGGGTSQAIVTVNSGGIFNLPNAATTVPFDVLNNGTVGVVTNLTLSDSTFTHNGTFALTVTNLSFLTTASTFIHNGTNFDDQDLVVNNSGTFVLQTAAAFSINSLLVQTTGIYEHRRLGAANITTVTVQSNGTLTHTANGSSKVYELHISATTIDIQSGSTVSVASKGFSSTNGTGQGTDGAEAGGAAHGGDGGNADAGTAGGVTYGDPKQPTTLGSGGGDDTNVTSQQGGAGGGAIRFVATGTITVAGSITANGAGGVSNEAGGGAGGSIWLDADTVAGAGSITANGGAGSPTSASTVGGGGGGGGRISISFNTNTASGARQAFGGNRGGTTSAVGGAGGAGTVYFDDKNDAFPNGDLTVDNNNNAGIAASSETTQVTPASQTYDNLTIRNGTRYVIPSAMTLTVASGGTFTGGGATQPLLTVSSGGTFNLPNATQTVSGIDVLNNGTVGVVTNLTLSDSVFTHNGAFSSIVTNLSFLATASTFIHNGTNFDDQDLVIANSGTFVLQTAAAFNINSLLVQSTGTYEHRRLGAASITTVTVNSGGTMTHTANVSTKTYELHVSATTIDIQSGGTVSVASKGFSGSNGTGQGTDSSDGGGGGHGGDGGNGDAGTAGGITYGDPKQPTTLGSGGGDDTNAANQQGGAGGGAIRFEATGTITVAGTISANGANAVANEAGGGAGGSVWLDANTVAGAGAISANGGAGSPFTATTIGGGGGGGGRISITFNTSTASGTRQSFGGNRGGTTGGSIAGAGGAGTVYFDDKDDALPNGDLTVDNNNNAGVTASSETTQSTVASQTYDNVTTKNGARYVIPSAMTLTIAPGGAFTGGGNQPVFTIASGGTFDPGQASLTLTSVNIVNNGTVATTTSLTLSTSTFQHNGNFSAGLTSLTMQSAGTFIMQTINGLQLSAMSVQTGGTFEQRMVGAVTIGTVTVAGNLTHTANTTTKTSELNISANDINIQSGGTVNVNGKGFSASNGDGQGTDGTTAGGGGHCAAGGNSSAGVLGGAAYGTAAAPTTLGSGGGNDTNSPAGGAGGGTIKFDVSGTLTVNGVISANGTSATTAENAGGAGGAIWLAVGTWAGSSGINANGGNGFGTTAGGGGGGAGYARADYVVKTYSGTMTSTGGAKGGSGAAQPGGNCTPTEASGNNPTPSTTSISPTTKNAGDATFTLTVNGANFITSSVVRFAGTDRATTFVNVNQVTAQILASDIATGGSYNITVFNPGPGGGTSNAQVLNVNNPVPTTTSISPTTKAVGDADFTMTVNGTNFVSTSVVRIAGSGRATTFVSSTQLTATILESDMTSTGTFGITVFNPTPGGGTSNAQTFTVNNPVPVTTSIDPVEKNLGDEEFIMTVNGSRFVANSVVRFNGSNRTTTFIDDTVLEATIPASDMTSAGTFNITVFNPTPGGGTSNAQVFTVTQVDNPMPTTTDISPTSRTVGSGTFTMTVNGTDFIPSSVVRFDGSNRTTTFVDDTQLTATIPASDQIAEGTFNITVFNPTPGGGESNAQTFTVTPADNPVPTTTSISPTSKTVGDSTFTMTVNGTNFIASSVVRFSGSDRTTNFVSANQLTADIPASDMTAPGTFVITVFNPTPGGGSSNGQTFTVGNPVPTTTSISPDTKNAGDGAFTLTVNGTNFIASSVVRFNGSNRTTTFVNSAQVTASITSSDIATGGLYNITVFNPTPGGGTSNAQTLTVNNPVPTTTSISPTSKNQGDAQFTLTVNGTNFVSTSVVRFSGSDRTTTFVNSTQLTATIPSSDLANPGTFLITVLNPTPGGGTSNAQNFTVNPGTNPTPTTTSISPTSKTVGESAFTMTVDGTGFVTNSVVRFNGSNRTTTFVNSTQLTAAIPSSDLTTPGSFSIHVFNPTPGGGLSNAQTFTVVSTTPTTGNKVTLSRLKVGVVATVDIAFVLNSTLSTPLTVTFPAGFTVLSAATGGSPCLSNFGFTASTLTADKTSCSGAIVMTGATVQNPSTTGAYTITWVNDEPGSATVFITSDDQANVTASIDPTITFNVGTQASATACDGTYSGNGGAVPLGVLSVSSVASSDAASVPHICTRLTTDASSGSAVAVRSANGALASVSAPADTIASSTTTLTPGTAGYGLCVGSAGGDTGKTDPAGGPPSAAPARTAPFNGSCGTGSHAVGGLTTSFQNIWTVAAPSLNAFGRIYVKASISPSTAAHSDYTDTLTFIVTGTY